MAGEHDLIVHETAHSGIHFYLPLCAEIDTRYGFDRCLEVFVRDLFEQLDHIMPSATSDGVPLRSIAHLNQSMVLAEAHEGCEWKSEHLLGRTRPDASRHGEQIPVAEFRAVLALSKKITERHVIHRAVTLCHLCRFAIEAQNVSDHS